MRRAVILLAIVVASACQKTVVEPDRPCCNVGDAPIPPAPTTVAGTVIPPQESPVLFRASDGTLLGDISAFESQSTTNLLFQVRGRNGGGASMRWTYQNYDVTNRPRGGVLHVGGSAVVYGSLQVGIGSMILYENGREYVVYAGPPNSGGQGYRMLRILN